ncbi:MAG: hypothetical protein GX638_08395 [Crenarchaeota archaeon]|nr:hypothetical protein [Thermoproteota archaeon]
MDSKTREFETLLLNSIDEALLAIGESGRRSIYFHLENSFSIKKEMIVKKLDQFQIGLEKIFGVGARYIEIIIMKNLHSKIKKPLNGENNISLEFLKYVEAAKQRYIEDN